MYGTSLSNNVPITQPWEITEDILCLPFINICIEGSERMNGLLVSGWPAQEGPCGSTRPADPEIRAWQDGLFLKACSEEERYFVKSSFEKSLDSNADCWAEWQTVVHLHLKMNFSSKGGQTWVGAHLTNSWDSSFSCWMWRGHWNEDRLVHTSWAWLAFWVRRVRLRRNVKISWPL